MANEDTLNITLKLLGLDKADKDIQQLASRKVKLTADTSDFSKSLRDLEGQLGNIIQNLQRAGVETSKLEVAQRNVQRAALKNDGVNLGTKTSNSNLQDALAQRNAAEETIKSLQAEAAAYQKAERAASSFYDNLYSKIDKFEKRVNKGSVPLVPGGLTQFNQQQYQAQQKATQAALNVPFSNTANEAVIARSQASIARAQALINKPIPGNENKPNGPSFVSQAFSSAITGANQGLELLGKAIEGLTSPLKQAAEAGLEFERSITGIAAILQSTTVSRGQNGEPLSVVDQVTQNQERATSFQQTARRKLLPLGISGQSEATLVRSVIAGAAARGISLDENQAATIAERLGGSLKATRPDILNSPTLLSREIEDSLSGSSGAKKTILSSSILAPFAPGFSKAQSGSELIKSLNPLQGFTQALQNSNNPSNVINQLSAALDNLNTKAGDALLHSLVPGLKSLSSALTDEGFVDSLTEAAKGLGSFGSGLAKLGADIAKNPVTKYLLKGVELGGKAAGAAATPVGNFLNQAGSNIENLVNGGQKNTDALNLLNFAQSIAQDAIDNAPSKPADKSIRSQLNKVGISAGFKSDTSREEEFSGKAVSPAGQLIALQRRQEILSSPNALKELGEEGFNEQNRENAFLNADIQKQFREQALKRLDTGSFSGQQQAANLQLSNAQADIQGLKALKSLAQAQVEAAKNDEDRIKAVNTLTAVEDKLSEARKSETDAADKQVKLLQQSTQRSIATQDSGTVAGRSGILDTQGRGLINELNLANEQLLSNDPAVRENAKQQKAEILGNRLPALNTEKQFKPLRQQQTGLETNRAFANLSNFGDDAAKKLADFAVELTNATNATKNFAEEEGLRALGRTGQQLSAAKAAKAAGASDSEIQNTLGTEAGLAFGNEGNEAQFNKDLALAQLKSTVNRTGQEADNESLLSNQGLAGLQVLQDLGDQLPNDLNLDLNSRRQQALGLAQQTGRVGELNKSGLLGGLIGKTIDPNNVSTIDSNFVNSNSDVGGLFGDSLFSPSVIPAVSPGAIKSQGGIGGLFGFSQADLQATRQGYASAAAGAFSGTSDFAVPSNAGYDNNELGATLFAGVGSINSTTQSQVLGGPTQTIQQDSSSVSNLVDQHHRYEDDFSNNAGKSLLDKTANNNQTNQSQQIVSQLIASFTQALQASFGN